MRIVVKIFYYLSIIILAIESLALALMSGSESNIINLKNTESVVLLSISLVLLVVLVSQFFKKLQPYSLILSIIALLALIALNLNIKLSTGGYLYVFWIVLVVVANTYLIRKNRL
ncbi:hypothetical protein GCM10011531_28170 [Aquaticitalea lipolytica]|uniref:Uncharacterized protein n=1 Tax=Aquaticitalea lipolytica TaxID=1247562 RepID=A0A8J2TUN8_9FLAO|nr:hypothetical protein [Aquaticitalea lipolytica]GFZ94824.1 hypothetical protein GCM10011531_28170 [Aquaticitalea lipolytica]